ncbi:MAG: YihA family ribosome biogenesis GTP-binding protein [Epulopiscium sp.]|nr:YihA family ribosome biogenesis GTP-binding protein [Candidatus Epulonipiscium sp.]
MEVNNVELEVVSGNASQFPTSNLIEIAFAGKSNVGKSSLINTLINRRALARTSSQPGKTQTINFYNVENQMYFVDLPGYGYAKVSKEQRQQWGSFIETYLHERPQLKLILLLVDIRHTPSEQDHMMYQWMKHYGFPIIVIATKMDKLKRSQVSHHIAMVRQGLHMTEDEILIPFSAVTKQGKDEIWEKLDQTLSL